MPSQSKIIIVDENTIDIAAYHTWLSEDPKDGAIATFTGKVRTNESDTISLYLEHYPAMTNNTLNKIADVAKERFELNRVVVIHRVGEIQANENIVFIGVSSAHRKKAFLAVEFIIDMLKNEAPFWKKEKTHTGEKWVDVKKTDLDSLKKWN